MGSQSRPGLFCGRVTHWYPLSMARLIEATILFSYVAVGVVGTLFITWVALSIVQLPRIGFEWLLEKLEALIRSRTVL